MRCQCHDPVVFGHTEWRCRAAARYAGQPEARPSGTAAAAVAMKPEETVIPAAAIPAPAARRLLALMRARRAEPRARG